MPTPSSKDQGMLSVQIDACADSLPNLIRATKEQATAAQMAGDLASMRDLDNLALRYSAAFSTVLRHEIKEIDDSAIMDNAIKAFATINQSISGNLAAIAQINDFITTAKTIAADLDTAISLALKVAA